MGSLSGKPELATAATLQNDGFWPDIALIDFMDKYRIPSEYDNKAIENQVRLAMDRTNNYLKLVKLNLAASGNATLLAAAQAQVPSVEVSAMLHYTNAVYNRAKSKLLEHFNTVNRRQNAENAAKTSDDTACALMLDASYSISALIDMFQAEPVAKGDYGNNFYVTTF